MKVSLGVPCARHIQLYHPELFNEHESVILYNREEFKRTYYLIQDQTHYILKVDAQLGDDESHLMSYWYDLMERIHIMELAVQSFFQDSSSLQSYLDTYLYSEAKSIEKVNAESFVLEPAESLGASWL